MAELLLELFSEEIPAGMQDRAAADIVRLLGAALDDAGLGGGEMRGYVTPRRLTVVVSGVPTYQPLLKQELRGPRSDAPEKALQGFLRNAGLTSPGQCERRQTPKGEFWFATVEKGGAAAADVLPGLIGQVLAAFPWPKSMRHGDLSFQWVRPLHRVGVLFNGAPLPAGVQVGDRVFPPSATTEGHRFLSPGLFSFRDFQQYRDGLRARHVMLDAAERRRVITDKLQALASARGLTVKEDPALLDEVTGLVEWPVVLMGDIDARYMELPPEVLESAMRGHQKYFSLLHQNGRPAPFFAVVANMETADGGAAIIAGNKRVLRARLSDAEFFLQQDGRQRLEDRLPMLDPVVFQQQLGGMGLRIRRMAALAAALAAYVPGCGEQPARRAAMLAKADLTTRTVGEFPELQGVIGRYLALKDGEDPAVADAIAAHYAPQGPGAPCPTAPVSVAVALAEKLDTLCGFWLIGDKPTGSKDPFALRRAALGVIRLVLENELRIPLREIFLSHITGAFPLETCQGRPTLMVAPQPGMTGAHMPLQQSPEQIADDLLAFFADRLKVYLRERGAPHDHIQAVFGAGGEDDFLRLSARLWALGELLATEAGENLLAISRRAANILKAEEKKDGAPVSGAVDIPLLQLPAERALQDALRAAEAAGAAALGRGDFPTAMAALAQLRGPVDHFFEQVTVNADDPALRANRLRLLANIRDVMGAIADFSCIEGRRDGAGDVDAR